MLVMRLLRDGPSRAACVLHAMGGERGIYVEHVDRDTAINHGAGP